MAENLNYEVINDLKSVDIGDEVFLTNNSQGSGSYHFTVVSKDDRWWWRKVTLQVVFLPLEKERNTEVIIANGISAILKSQYERINIENNHNKSDYQFKISQTLKIPNYSWSVIKFDDILRTNNSNPTSRRDLNIATLQSRRNLSSAAPPPSILMNQSRRNLRTALQSTLKRAKSMRNLMKPPTLSPSYKSFKNPFTSNQKKEENVLKNVNIDDEVILETTDQGFDTKFHFIVLGKENNNYLSLGKSLVTLQLVEKFDDFDDAKSINERLRGIFKIKPTERTMISGNYEYKIKDDFCPSGYKWSVMDDNKVQKPEISTQSRSKYGELRRNSSNRSIVYSTSSRRLEPQNEQSTSNALDLSSPPQENTLADQARRVYDSICNNRYNCMRTRKKETREYQRKLSDDEFEGGKTRKRNKRHLRRTPRRPLKRRNHK